MRYTARRRLFVSATAGFAALMLAALAVITRDGISAAINQAMFGVLVVLWSAALAGFPFALIALPIRSPKAARWHRSRSAEREDNVEVRRTPERPTRARLRERLTERDTLRR
jgi:hypothetical protein